MRFTTSVVAATAVLATANAAATPAKCNADNCLRALRATQVPSRVESARAFCSSYTAAGATNVPVPTYAASGCKDNQNGKMNERISSACGCLSSATSTTTAAPTKTAEPCALASADWASRVSASPNAVPSIAASLAHDCLQSVPFNKERAAGILKALEPYLDWQSDAAYLKDPPTDYEYSPYDLFAGFKEVMSKVDAGKYSGEYEFQKDIQQKIYFPGVDGHFWLTADSMSVFSFRSPRGVVSYSEDGVALPVIKILEDYKLDFEAASVLLTINGQDASEFIEELAKSGTYSQDVDTAYNTFFYQASRAPFALKGQFGSAARSSPLYRGPDITFGFANGTSTTLPMPARVNGNLTGVTDGASFYQKFCQPLPPAPPSQPDPNDPEPPLTGYPKPVVRTNDNVVTGYYLQGAGVDNVAVLAMNSFEPKSTVEFQSVIQDFLAGAAQAGKTKLVIDLQGNGGGYIALGYELFKQVFPDIHEDGFSRWKESDGFVALAKTISDKLEGFDPANSNDSDLINIQQSELNWRYDVNTTFGNFVSYDDKFAPHVYKNTPYSNLMAWNWSDPLTTANATFGIGIDITGYRSRKNATKYYNAEDVILLYDGDCASTCSITSELLRLNAGVKSVVFGGRPRAGPQQTIGGVKGSQVYKYSDILWFTSRASNWTDDAATKAILAKYTDITPFRIAGSVNVRDQIVRDHLDDGTPSQFVAEYADCRRFWTKPMIDDIQEVWKAAAQSGFHNADCNWGGIKRTSSAQSFAQSRPVPGSAPTFISYTVDKTSNPEVQDIAWRAHHLVEAPKLEG
ncbi:pyridine nucleotide-disulfide oxidoreductase family protein [Cordyceps militaris CM01]|uniref:Pyridine nucleotide-disulfide oxidoreductase family protein n=1 Tax=Cordyceps militaris (strain CM01) TaxID=983644 RepID=G3JA79_CORMM|nr:pyridine nucleotide-disulfide oxidoreductase family protein [Cordyceps militaris CM01]EGX94249.1 pyridine nucleotide-disulfide oxidoreductase family protein [Cordyceps militaris CM01]